MNKVLMLILLIIITTIYSCSDLKRIIISSPGRKIKVSLSLPENDKNHNWIYFSVRYRGKPVLLKSSLELKFDEKEFGRTEKIYFERESISNSWINEFGERRNISDNYNLLKLGIRKGSVLLNIYCRAYNEGIALAWEVPEQEGISKITINDEKFIFRFPADYIAWSALRAQAQYRKKTISKIDRGCERPLVIEYDSTLTIALTEAALVDFARMKFYPDSSGGISLSSRLDGMVKKDVPFRSPWRILMIGESPGELLENNYLILNLNEPSAIKDISWIKPGKVLREVTLTTAGAIKLIDFISAHRMQYIEFDAGWYGYEYDDSSDARTVSVDPRRSKGPLNLPRIISYAHSKDIGVLLYVNRRALERQLDDILPLYSEWGISGLKLGFVQVGTQKATTWIHETIKKAANYKMIVDVHDEYRPTGYSRTYPNLLTQEGIRGDEESPANSHTLITMFTRMIAGAGDNTICYYDRRVEEKMGSHASQLAKAVCLFSPLQFLYWYDKCVPDGKEEELYGKPNYLGNEPELEFFDNVPVTWDETKVLYGKIGEYGIIARRKDEDWFIGGINGNQPRNMTIWFSFLKPGKIYKAKIYSDDPEISTRTHVKIDETEFDLKSKYIVKLEKNKGFAMHLHPQLRENSINSEK